MQQTKNTAIKMVEGPKKYKRKLDILQENLDSRCDMIAREVSELKSEIDLTLERVNTMLGEINELRD